MNVVVLEQLSKRFGNMQAVQDVSLTVQAGEIFGLLGPNGAGKTTTIRMLLDIIRPDSGRVDLFGGPINEAKKNRIGYLPEERGLYADIKLHQVILYLASLKGMHAKTATTEAETYLKRLDLWDHRQKPMKQLSRGMHQKAQFIVTILHNPDLVIVDEPFSGLDPVNIELIEKLLNDLRAKGKAIIMSSHQMHQVEMMCDRIALIHNGRVVLSGAVEEIKRQHAGHEVEVRGTGAFDQLPGVTNIEHKNGLWRLSLAPEMTPQQLLKEVAGRAEMSIDHFAVALPRLHDIFIQTVSPKREN